jgi:hypothetical protein
MSDDMWVLAESGASAAAVLSRVDDSAWAAAAVVRLAAAGAFDDDDLAPTEPENLAAVETLAAVGLAVRDGTKFVLAPGLVELARDGTLQTRVNAMVSSLRQLAMAVGICRQRGRRGLGCTGRCDPACTGTILRVGRHNARGVRRALARRAQ